MNNKNNKSNAIFLAGILVAGGLIGITSPFVAFAQGYDEYAYQEDYDSYDPYKSDKKESKYSTNPVTLIGKCDNINVNIFSMDQQQVMNNDFLQQDKRDLLPVQQQEQESDELTRNMEQTRPLMDSLVADQTEQELTPEEAWNTLTSGNGDSEPFLNIDRNVVTVCFNDNDLDLHPEFTGGTQEVLSQPEFQSGAGVVTGNQN